MDKPKTRGDCENGIRPCPWVSCKYHLAIDVKGKKVSEREGWLDSGLPTCALDVAEDGCHSLEQIGKMTPCQGYAGNHGSISKQAVVNFLVRSKRKFRHNLKKMVSITEFELLAESFGGEYDAD